MADGDNLLLGEQNTSSSETRITRNATIPNVSSLVVDNDSGHCVVGNSTFVGPSGDTSVFAGVVGTSSTGNGVQGVSQEGIGVVGRCPARNGTAVRGEAPGRGGTGVHGEAEFTGVFALATPGPREGSAVGVFGEANLEAAGDGVAGFGVMGVERSGEGWAGAFFGRVQIGGDLRVGGDLIVEGAKSAVLRHRDGSLRRMYALESPESWFEDFGRAEVVDGRAEVKLDNEFAAMVRTDDYHVFLTPEGESQGLYVSARRPSGFEVREQQGGRSNLTFSYRVVAKRSDIEARRLQRLEAPAELAEVLPPQSPEPPESR